MDLEQAHDLMRAHGALISAVAALIGLTLLVRVMRTPWFIGFLGELRIKSIVGRQLDGSVYHAVHDVTLPASGGTTQIDHILVSPYGVFVIETKNMKGRIYGRANDRQWTQAFIGRSYTFLNPLRQNYKHVKAVDSALALGDRRIHSIVVFVGSATFAKPMPENVCEVGAFVSTVRSRTRILLSDAEIRGAIDRLEAARIPTLIAGWLHRRTLRQIQACAHATRTVPRTSPGPRR